MTINRSIDIEEEVRTALLPYQTAYCRPLPAEYNLPNILITLCIKDRYLPGHHFGAFGYENKKVTDIAFELEMTVDGVYKAVKAAQAHAYEIVRRGQ